MSSDLSIFAARLRDFIGIASGDSLYLEPSPDPALNSHLDVEFNGMAIVLFGLQFHHNAAYRKICEARKISPDSITHWSQIPAAPTVAFKEMELTCLPLEQRCRVFHSSGTTEQRPSRHFHSAESLEIYEASLWPWFQIHLPAAMNDARLAILTPSLAQAPHSSLVHMFDTVRRKLNVSESAFLGNIASAGEWTLNLEATTAALREAAETVRPLVVLGTAFSFVHLLDGLAEQNLRFELPAGSRVMETGGYKGRSRIMPKVELHALITARLGIPAEQILCEYGMSELSSQAYDGRAALPRRPETDGRAAARPYQFPPWARVRIVSPETGKEVVDGESGLIRVFDLANVFSVMAIQTEDLAIRRGKTFELIGRTEQSEPRGCSLMATDA